MAKETKCKKLEKTSKVKKVNQKNIRKPESWEINVIGKFLLSQNRSKLFCEQNNYLAPKSEFQERFEMFLNQPENKEICEKFAATYNKVDINSILFRTGFLMKTDNKSEYYRINRANINEHRKKLLDECDENQNLDLNNTNVLPSNTNQTDINKTNKILNNLEAAMDFEVDDTAEIHELSYERTIAAMFDTDFKPSKWCCYICQKNFDELGSYEQHVGDHGVLADLKLNCDFEQNSEQLLKISYQLCKNSHYFCFTIQSGEPNVIIDKIIVIQSPTIFYVQDEQVPYELPTSGKDKFYVDSHLFVRNLEQNIVIIFHAKSRPLLRLMEEHHFTRIEEFPKMVPTINQNRLSCSEKFKSQHQLPEYLPPPKMRNALLDTKSMDSLYSMCNEFADYCTSGQTLTQKNFCAILNMLLQIEDTELLEQYRPLTQFQVTLHQCNKEISLKLNIDNSTEVVLAPYDIVLMIPKNANPKGRVVLDDDELVQNVNKIYRGVVTQISNENVTILSDSKIDERDTYTVVFQPMRLSQRYQYRALQLLDKLQPKHVNRFLFPSNLSPPRKIHLTDLTLFDQNIANNPEQLNAVVNIAHGPKPEAPYIIFGPPGTGKTTTVTEAIMQLYVRRPNTRILITASSNSACDEVTMRLYNFLKPRNESRAIVRIYARTIESMVDNIDENLVECSNIYNEHFYPSVDILHEYRIVVCTLNVVGKLSTGKFGSKNGRGWYTHIFVDECAASTETEALVGIAATLSPVARLIISGDHKQLGPILKSNRANSLGLGKSLLERLLDRECYRVNDDGTYNDNYQTRLCRNFRSHTEIVRLYNELYYDGELIAQANDNDVCDIGCNWYRCPNPDFPIIFHEVCGSSAQDSNSNSLYNAAELEVVIDYVRDLMYFGVNGKKVNQTDIGIISPYKRQCQYIQEQLNLRKWYNILTGSVETFQGKEKKIVIVSFVRSLTKTIGFLKNPLRLNVTLSRAKSLLILIGNSKTLTFNDDFKHIILECEKHKTLISDTFGRNEGKSILKIRNAAADNMKKAAAAVMATSNNNVKSSTGKEKAALRNRIRIDKEQQSKQCKENNFNEQKLHQQTKYLRHPMKKRAMSPSMQMGRMKFVKCKRSMEMIFDKNKIGQKGDLDELFKSLPPVPKQQTSLIKLKKKTRKSKKTYPEIEKDLLEHIRRLNLRGRRTSATSSLTSISTVTSTKNLNPKVVEINSWGVLLPAEISAKRKDFSFQCNGAQNDKQNNQRNDQGTTKPNAESSIEFATSNDEQNNQRNDQETTKPNAESSIEFATSNDEQNNQRNDQETTKPNAESSIEFATSNDEQNNQRNDQGTTIPSAESSIEFVAPNSFKNYERFKISFNKFFSKFNLTKKQKAKTTDVSK